MQDNYPVTYLPFLIKAMLLFCINITPLPRAFAETSLTDSLHHQMIQKIEKEEKDSAFVNRVNAIAWAYLNTEPDSSLYYSEKALEQARKIFYLHGQAHAVINMGRYYRNKGNFPEALKHLLEALRLYEQDGDLAQVGHSYTDIGVVHNMNGSKDLCLKNFLKAKEVFEKLGNKKGIAHSYNNLGILHEYNGEDSLALAYYQKALEIKKELGNKQEIGVSLNNLGGFYNDQNDYSKAIQYYEEALNYFKESSHPIGLISTYSSMANTYLSFHQPGIAKKYYEQALELTEKIQSGVWKSKVLEDYITYFEKTGNYKKASFMYKDFIGLKDSLFNSEKSKQMAEMQTRFETDQKEQQIALLEKENQLDQIKKYALGAGLSLSLALGWLLYYFQQMKRKSEQELYQKESKLQRVQTAMAQKERDEAQMELTYNQKMLNFYMNHFKEKNQHIEQLKVQIEVLKNHKKTSKELPDVHYFQLLNSTLMTEEEWAEFKQLFVQVHGIFFEQIQRWEPAFTEEEIRIAALLKLKMQTKEIAGMLGIAPENVIKFKYQIKKKLHIHDDQKLESFIEEMGAEGKDT
ncbi:tetratricopeptide repeat protein [Rapidithrix thailandica]|uniref:Tetratricopeptide repeat protein n=1 Tax=Rapidithrix thailandica TaxID=413964 RepID=A0AAW9S083_9BACT